MSLIQQKHFHFHLRRPQIFLVQDWALGFGEVFAIFAPYISFTNTLPRHIVQNTIYITGVGRTTPTL